MTLAPPPVVEDYFSLTPLIIRLCEDFTACPVKCSSPIDNFTGHALNFLRDAAQGEGFAAHPERRPPGLLALPEERVHQLCAACR